jgi:hypothetical protein
MEPADYETYRAAIHGDLEVFAFLAPWIIALAAAIGIVRGVRAPVGIGEN